MIWPSNLNTDIFRGPKPQQSSEFDRRYFFRHTSRCPSNVEVLDPSLREKKSVKEASGFYFSPTARRFMKTNNDGKVFVLIGFALRSSVFRRIRRYISPFLSPISPLLMNCFVRGRRGKEGGGRWIETQLQPGPNHIGPALISSSSSSSRPRMPTYGRQA